MLSVFEVFFFLSYHEFPQYASNERLDRVVSLKKPSPACLMPRSHLHEKSSRKSHAMRFPRKWAGHRPPKQPRIDPGRATNSPELPRDSHVPLNFGKTVLRGSYTGRGFTWRCDRGKTRLPLWKPHVRCEFRSSARNCFPPVHYYTSNLFPIYQYTFSSIAAEHRIFAEMKRALSKDESRLGKKNIKVLRVPKIHDIADLFSNISGLHTGEGISVKAY